MFGLRLCDLDGGLYELGVSEGKFTEVDAHVDDWIDASGGFAVAGLVDAHAHLSAGSVATMVAGSGDGPELVKLHAGQHLAGGVLALADKGGRDNLALSLLDLPVDERPEAQLAGPIVSVEDGYYRGFGLVVDPEAPVEDWLDAVTPHGVSWVKIVGDWPRKGRGAEANFSRERIASIVEAAHARDLRVAIHTTAPGAGSDAVAAGVDSIEHGLFLNAEDLEQLGRRGGAWVPTIAAMEGIRDMLGADSSGGKMFGKGLDNVRNLLPYAPDLGVRVLAGTDLYLPHGQVASEASKLHEYGLDSAAAVASITTEGYAYLGLQRNFVPGAVADVVVFRDDPRENLDTLSNPILIVRAGRIIQR